MDANHAQLGRAGELRLGLLIALDSALHRRHEVADLISASTDTGEAAEALMALLGCDRHGADAVLNMRWGQLTRSETRRIQEDRRAQQAALADPPASG